MLATAPDILTLSIKNNLEPKIHYFKNTLCLSDEQLRYVLLKRPQLLALNLNRNIIPKIDFFLREREEVTDERSQDNYGGGLGMAVEEIVDWIVQYPQTLTCALENRIRPRIFDVKLGHHLGDEEGMVPLNFFTRSERSWEQWKTSYLVVLD